MISLTDSNPPSAEKPIPGADPHPRKRVRVLDTEMSYVELGHGDPIVLLHGNPTSSYRELGSQIEMPQDIAPAWFEVGAGNAE